MILGLAIKTENLARRFGDLPSDLLQLRTMLECNRPIKNFMKNKKQNLFLIYIAYFGWFLAAFLMTTVASAARLPSKANPCAVSDLSFSVDYKNGYFNGMSHSGALLVLHNKGSQACAIAARPIVGFEDARHVPLPISWQSPKGMYPGPVLLPVVVPKNAEVTSQIRWVSSEVFDKNKCISPVFITLSIKNDLLRSPFTGNLCGPADKHPTYTLTLFKYDST